MTQAKDAREPGSTRVNQRLRTRQALLYAARELIDAGRSPTVAEAADAALVSRATAYRYFPSQDSLLSECLLMPDLPTPEELLGGPTAPADAEDRVVLVHDFLFDFITARETLFRHYVRNQLLIGLKDNAGDRSLRPGFRVPMLGLALGPAADELGAGRVARLVTALGCLIGTEAIIAAIDVLQLDYATARADNGWACRALVRTALAEARAARPDESAGELLQHGGDVHPDVLATDQVVAELEDV